MTTKPNYNVDGKPGLARTVVSRTSGTRINIWFAPEAKSIKANADKPWVVECEDHKARRECVTRTEARQHREDPASFCAKCKAGAKKAAPAKAKPSTATAKNKAAANGKGKTMSTTAFNARAKKDAANLTAAQKRASAKKAA